MSYTKIRICNICKKEDIIRKDNKSATCKKCSLDIKREKSIKTIKSKVKFTQCKTCGKDIPLSKNQTYCSKECHSLNKKEKRECKCCGKEFLIYTSSLNTNASGNFCSRKCYENYLCDTDRTTGRGSQWKKIRNIAIKKAPFCAICGTTKNLQVHHIIPFRYTNDNSQSNLIPLCIKHHKKIEIITNDILKVHRDFKISKLIISSMLKENQLATFAKIKAVVVNSKKLIDNKEWLI